MKEGAPRDPGRHASVLMRCCLMAVAACPGGVGVRG